MPESKPEAGADHTDEVRWCVVANVLHDRVLRTGAKVYILHGYPRPVVAGVSKYGKRVRKRIPFKRLTNFRAAMLHPQLANGRWGQSETDPIDFWPDKAEAESWAEDLAETWRGIRSFDADGNEVVPGEPEAVAVQRDVERYQKRHQPLPSPKAWFEAVPIAVPVSFSIHYLWFPDQPALVLVIFLAAVVVWIAARSLHRFMTVRA